MVEGPSPGSVVRTSVLRFQIVFVLQVEEGLQLQAAPNHMIVSPADTHNIALAFNGGEPPEARSAPATVGVQTVFLEVVLIMGRIAGPSFGESSYSLVRFRFPHEVEPLGSVKAHIENRHIVRRCFPRDFVNEGIPYWFFWFSKEKNKRQRLPVVVVFFKYLKALKTLKPLESLGFAKPC